MSSTAQASARQFHREVVFARATQDELARLDLCMCAGKRQSRAMGQRAKTVRSACIERAVEAARGRALALQGERGAGPGAVTGAGKGPQPQRVSRVDAHGLR